MRGWDPVAAPPMLGLCPLTLLGAPPAVVVCAQLPTSHIEQAILPVPCPEVPMSAKWRGPAVKPWGRWPAGAPAVSWEIRCMQQCPSRERHAQASKGGQGPSTWHGAGGREQQSWPWGSLQPLRVLSKSREPRSWAGAGGAGLEAMAAQLGPGLALFFSLIDVIFGGVVLVC